MIHDIDIILSLIPSPVKRVRLLVLPGDREDRRGKGVDGVRNGTAASLTSSRISKEKERKMKVFQRNSYIELDYQEGVVELRSRTDPANPEIVRPGYREPLKEELKDLSIACSHRERPRVSGAEGRNALHMALEITALAEGRS